MANNFAAKGFIFGWQEFKTIKVISTTELSGSLDSNSLENKVKETTDYFVSQFKNCKLQNK